MSENSLVWNFIAKDKASKVVDSLGSKVGTLGKTIAIGFGGAALAGVAALSKGFVDGLKDAAAYQAIASQTAAVIKSTGNVAHLSVQGLEDMAGSLESLSGVDEELILHGENVIATFTNIRNSAGKGNDVFNQATKAALNLSVALGQDMQSSAIQVGKALNDPIKGVTALQRVGVTFTEQQKKQIEQMVKAGDTMGAQKVILKELNTEFGGAAKAAGDTFGGSIARLKDIVGDTFRNIASQSLPLLTKFVDVLADRLPGAIATAERVVGRFAGVVRDALGRVDWGSLASHAQDAVRTVQGVLGRVDVRGITSTLSKIDFSGIAKNLQTQASKWGGAIISGIKTGMDTGNWSDLGNTIGKGIVSALSNIGNALIAGASKLTEMMDSLFSKIDWLGIGISIGKQAPTLLVGLAAGILNFDLMGLLQGVAAHWQDIILAIVAIAFTPGKIIGKVAEVLTKIPLVGKLLAWGLEHFSAFSKGLVKMVWDALGFMGEAFLSGFRRVFPEAGEAFSKGLSLLPTRLGLLVIEIQLKILGMMRGIGEGILKGITYVVSGIGELIARMLLPFVRADTWLVQKGAEFLSGLGRGILNGLGSIPGLISSVIHRVTDPFSPARAWLETAGNQLLQGLMQGALNALNGIGSWAARIGNRIVGAVKSFFGISSPSKVFMGLGVNLLDGLVNGMASRNPLDIARSVFGSLPSALGAIVSKGLVNVANLPGSALSALGGLGGKFAGLVSSATAGLFDSGGWLMPGTTGYNASRKREAVFTQAQLAEFKNGNSADTTELERMQSRTNDLLEQMNEALSARQGIRFNNNLVGAIDSAYGKGYR